MTRQISDIIKMNKKEHEIAAASDFNALLKIEDFGFEPAVMHTACYKGYYVDFKVENGVLLLDNLTIVDKNKNYPDINGVSAKTTRFARGSLKDILSFIKEYSDINLQINYTGHIYTADKIILNGRMKWDYSLDLKKCEGVKDWYFEDGVLMSITDVKEP